MRYHLLTLGCPKNVADSGRLERLLQEAGHRPTSTAKAQMIIVNTCGFIDRAKEESVNAILRLAAEKGPGQSLVVAGCLSQLSPQGLRDEIPEIDHVFGVEAGERIAALAGEARRESEGEESPRLQQPRVSAYLKIADGCNARCSFCIIPKIKGRLHSTPIDALVGEARRLSEEGARELVLVAQDSTAYGRDLGMRDGLPLLLRELAARVPEVEWLRVMYGYPGHVSAELAETMASLPQVCHYLDLPLQHSSPAVLRRMRRPHDEADLRRTLERLRKAMPDVALRTTLLVGFPGETEEEFQRLLDFVCEAGFDHVGAFPFSPQPGTAAAGMPGQVPERVKRRRYRQLMAVAKEVSLARNRGWVGREMAVLVESEGGTTAGDERVFVGRSFRDAPEIDGLTICSGEALPGEMRRVRIVSALPYDLLAEPVTAAKASRAPS
ncbi:MAG: 30S ribosomal protein S12 methylthiotransferase RimO [Dehalococcoidia bacterium]|jgi:ribosomal protein S12 methylthiotransferase